MNNSVRSVHLQNFPEIKDFEVDRQLIDKMDKVRAICSCALFIRDKNNLRVRLPLNKITIVAADVDGIKEFSNIILDEINVKNVEFNKNISGFSSNKLVLDFKKIGPKVGGKMSEVIKAAKDGNWVLDGDKLAICGFKLDEDEFKLSLEPNDKDIFVVDNYDILIKLDLKITEELEREGVVRDLVRIIQQFRKEADLNISDKINLKIYTDYNFLTESVEKFRNYISEQTLAKSLGILPTDKTGSSSSSNVFTFSEVLNDNKIIISFKVAN